jgi:predicted DNA-binding protein (MmcQ/YjbR family)
MTKSPIAALRAHCLSYPEAVEEHPWGENAFKVRKKIFCVVSEDGSSFRVSMKLPHSSGAALMFAFATPTGYGLGKSGWITASFGKNDKAPLGLLEAWIDESYRAIAPKALVKSLD